MEETGRVAQKISYINVERWHNDTEVAFVLPTLLSLLGLNRAYGEVQTHLSRLECP